MSFEQSDAFDELDAHIERCVQFCEKRDADPNLEEILVPLRSAPEVVLDLQRELKERKRAVLQYAQIASAPAFLTDIKKHCDDLETFCNQWLHWLPEWTRDPHGRKKRIIEYIGEVNIADQRSVKAAFNRIMDLRIALQRVEAKNELSSAIIDRKRILEQDRFNQIGMRQNVERERAALMDLRPPKVSDRRSLGWISIADAERISAINRGTVIVDLVTFANANSRNWLDADQQDELCALDTQLGEYCASLSLPLPEQPSSKLEGYIFLPNSRLPCMIRPPRVGEKLSDTYLLPSPFIEWVQKMQYLRGAAKAFLARRSEVNEGNLNSDRAILVEAVHATSMGTTADGEQGDPVLSQTQYEILQAYGP